MKATFLACAAALMGPATGYSAPANDTLVVGLSVDASTFDPGQISSRDNANIAKHIFGTLYAVQADGTIWPDLAKSYALSEDGLVYTYTLKQGLACDDGEPLTAEDVAYSFNRAADPANAFTGNTPGFVYSTINFKGAEAVDDLNVKVAIGEKNAVAFGMISQVYIHCKDSYEKMSLDQAASAPIGSGSYRLASWSRGSEIVLEKVRDPGNFKKIVWRIIPEASTRTAELIAGNVDIITNLAPDQAQAVESSGTASVQKVKGTRRIFVGFNQKPSFSDTPGGAAIRKPDVRRALQYAVDVPTICLQLLNFACERAASLVNPPNDNPALKPYPYDPATAEKLLDAAGYPRDASGVRFEIKLQSPRGRYLNDANVALAVGQYLSDVGVKTEVELLDWASVYSTRIRSHDAGPLFLLGMGGVTWSPLYDMAAFGNIEATTNYPEWSDPRWFDSWSELKAAKDPAEERAIINRMLQIFYDDGPWLQMYFQPDFYGVSKRIQWEARRDEEIDLFSASLVR